MKPRLRVYEGPGTAAELVPKLQAMIEKMQPPIAPEPLPKKPLPLGDVVERFAKPIAAVIDSVTADLSPLLGQGNKLATNMSAGCSPCGQRRQVLNNLVPDIRKPDAWQQAAGRALTRFTKGRKKT